MTVTLTSMLEQSDNTPGFHPMKSALEKVPNMVVSSSQVFMILIWYHTTQLLAMPFWTGDGIVDTVGGKGRLSEGKAATQYQ